MEKLKLNRGMGQLVSPHGYALDATKKYVINLENESEEQISILEAARMFDLPAILDWHKWLKDNGFDIAPTNDYVSKFFGKEPLWISEKSQGIVVMAENDDDYYVVLECSRQNEGFKYTQIIVTLGGCF